MNFGLKPRVWVYFKPQGGEGGGSGMAFKKGLSKELYPFKNKYQLMLIFRN